MPKGIGCGKGGMKKAAKGMKGGMAKGVAKKAMARKKEAIAGGGGMHQMGTAQKTKKPMNAKQRALMALRKKKGKII